MEDGGDGSVEVTLLLKNRAQEGEVKDIALVKVDSLLVRSDVLPLRQIMGDRLENPT